MSTKGNALNAFRYEYNLTDHLGNVRLVFADLNSNGRIDQTSSTSTNEILQENHYYPFGMTHYGSYSTNTGVGEENRYRYNGKELNEDLGLYDYGARWYDPAVARFTTIDRFAEKYSYQTPYAYAANNPINFIDVNGDSLGVVFNDQASLTAYSDLTSTDAGLAFVALFAAKGQVVNGHEFTSDGAYHEAGIDLTFSDRDFGEGKESTGGNTTGGTNGGKIEGGRLKLGVSLNTTSESYADREGKAVAIVHEAFLHVQEYADDFVDNQSIDYSHHPYYEKLTNNSKSSRHHLKIRQEAQKGQTAFGTNGLQILEKVNTASKGGKSRTDLWNRLWNFSN